MKPHSFFKNLSVLLALNMLVKPVWIFLIDRVVQNQLGYQVYGRYFALLNLSYVLLFIADAGLSNMLNQKLARNQAVNIRQLFFGKVFLLLLYLLACMATGLLTQIDQWQIFGYIISIQTLNSLFTFLRSIITAQQFFKTDAWFSVMDKTLVIIFCAPFLYGASFGSISLLLFLQLQLVATGISVVTALSFVLSTKININSLPQKTTAVLAQILPFTVIILLMSAHYRLDGFLLERLHINGAYEAGLYAAGYRLLDAGNMVGYLAAGFLVPFIARNFDNKNVVAQTILFTRHCLLFFGVTLACFVWVNAKWLQQLLYVENNSGAASVLRLCVAALPAYLLTHIYGSALTATSKFSSFIYLLVFSVAINVLVNLWLIPIYGASGAATAALVSQYICAIGCMVLVHQKLGIKINALSIFLTILAAALFYAIFYFGDALSINVWLTLLFAVILVLASSFIFRSPIKKFFTLIE